MTIFEKIENLYDIYSHLAFEDLTFEVIHNLAEGTWLVYNETDMSDRAFMDEASEYFINFCKVRIAEYVKTIDADHPLHTAVSDPVLLEMCHVWYRRKIFEISNFKFKHGEPY